MRIGHGVIFLLWGIVITGCGEPEPRKPLAKHSSTFIKESVERNKALVREEEALVRLMMERDTVNRYIGSENGFWYFYEVRNPLSTGYPEVGDKVLFRYDLRMLNEEVIYTEDELGVNTYVVDEQYIMEGLRYAIKLMKEGEIAYFYFPSHLGYGYSGDGDRIGINVPLISRVHIIKIDKNTNEND